MVFRKTPEGRLLTGLFALRSDAGPEHYAAALRQRIQAVFGLEPAGEPLLWAGHVGLTRPGGPACNASTTAYWPGPAATAAAWRCPSCWAGRWRGN